MEHVAAAELTASLAKLYDSGEYSDLTVVCGDDTYKVHKAIVCPRSEFFSRACKEGRWKEGEDGRIVLYREEPETARQEADLIKWMIHYLYHLDYLTPPAPEPSAARDPPSRHPFTPHRPIPLGLGPSSSRAPQAPSYHSTAYGSSEPQQRNSFVLPAPPLVMDEPEPKEVDQTCNPLTHARMYAIADYYEIAGLKQLAETKFRQAVGRFWNSPEFAQAVHVVYTTTLAEDRGLRQIVKDALLGHMGLMNKPEIESIMREVPDLSFDMLKGLWLRDGARNDYLPPPSPTQPLSDVWRSIR